MTRERKKKRANTWGRIYNKRCQLSDSLILKKRCISITVDAIHSDTISTRGPNYFPSLFFLPSAPYSPLLPTPYPSPEPLTPIPYLIPVPLPLSLTPSRAPKLPILVCGRYDTASGPFGAKIHTTDASLVIHCCYDNELGPLNNASG